MKTQPMFAGSILMATLSIAAVANAQLIGGAGGAVNGAVGGALNGRIGSSGRTLHSAALSNSSRTLHTTLGDSSHVIGGQIVRYGFLCLIT